MGGSDWEDPTGRTGLGGPDNQFQGFLFHVRGSLIELETQVLRAGKLQYLTAEQSLASATAPRHRWAGV
jgi:hypothetical protein